MAVNVSCCDILQAARDWQWRTVLVDQTLHCNCSVSGLTDLSDKAQRQRAVYHTFFFFFFYVVFTDRLVDQAQFQGPSTLTTMLMLSLLISWWIKFSYKDRLP